MADKRISELNALTAPVKDDAVLISDTSASETKKITFQKNSTKKVKKFKTVQAANRHYDKLIIDCEKKCK